MDIKEQIRTELLKHLINIDIIETYMLIHNLSSEGFCIKCGISEKAFEEIMERRLEEVPYAVQNICEVLECPLSYIVNYDILRYLKI